MNIVFDIGGTNMRVAAVRDGVLGEIKKTHTLQNPYEAVIALADVAKILAGADGIAYAVGSVSGTISDSGVISDARNLRHWEGMNVVKKISEALGADAIVVNDAGAVGLGEAMKGAGKGVPVVGYITVSTGVGGARIENGKITGGDGIGWTQVRGTDIESQISGTAVRKKFGVEPKDFASLDERNKLADILAEGLAIIYKQWKPDVFVIGGSMIVGVNPIPLDRVREKFTKVPVVMAELKDDGGLIGAAILAERQ